MERNGNREETIDEALLARQGETVTAIVRLPRADVSTSQTRTGCIETLREAAGRAQQPVEEFARERDGVTLTNSFWIANAVVLEVDTGRVPLVEIARVPDVERIHGNFEVEAFDDGDRGRFDGTTDDESAIVWEPSEDGVESTDHGEHTYGLEQINVPEVWDEHGTQGEGVKVAVLDTGIDVDHPDLHLYSDDPDDPTYPGGWAEFDGDGEQIAGSEPYDSDGHGTHVSGTVAGGGESGTHIGVAPDVDLVHGLVLPGGTGSFVQIIGGIQWAVEEAADVINMSLGAGGYFSDIVDPLQNAQSAGALPVSACGNSGEGTSGSPANVYGAGMAVGASDEDEKIADFSSGELIDTDDAWGDDAPDDWPEEYVVPDVAAPGVAVKSSVPGGGYDDGDGTSMASPHVAGVAALMVSASAGSLSPTEMWNVFEDTAWKPDDWDEEEDAEWAIDGKDSRYGKGIVDAKAAVDQVALDSGIEGTVTDSEGTPREDIVVEADADWFDTTDGNGEYAISLQPGDYTVTADAFGFEKESDEGVLVSEDAFTERNFTLETDLDGRLLDAQPAAIEGGESLHATIAVAHADTATVSQEGSYAENDVTLEFDGEPVDFDEPIGMDGGINEVVLSVSTAPDTAGEIALSVTLDDGSGSVAVSTGSTAVHDELQRVGVIDANNAYDDDVVATLDATLDSVYRAETTTTETVVGEPGSYVAVVAHTLDDTRITEFVEATETAAIGVVYLDQYAPDAPNAARALSQFATESDAISETGRDLGGSVPVSYEAVEEHPLLGGIDVDEAVAIHTGPDGDHTWFDLVDEQDAFDVVADVSHDEAVAGSGLAVDGETRTVLAGTLGRSQWVPGSVFTDDANEILASAVESVVPEDSQTSIDVSGATIAPEEEAMIEITAETVDEVVVRGLWTDWVVDVSESDGGTVTPAVETEGSVTVDWGDDVRSSTSLSITLSPPKRYESGRYVIEATASSPDGTASETAILEIKPP